PAEPECRRAAAVALRTGGQGGAGSGPGAAAGAARLHHRQRDRNLPAERGHPERHFDDGLERLAARLLAASPAEDRGKDVSEAEPADIVELEILGRPGACPAA